MDRRTSLSQNGTGQTPATGGRPAFYRVFEMWFDSPEPMAAVFDTPEGKKVRADVANFTQGTSVTRLVCKVH